MEIRQRFVREAMLYLRTPYIWGGDDPSGFDCSGLVVECLKAVGKLKEHEDLSANGLWERFKHLEQPEPRDGCMVFWFHGDRAYHIAICEDRESCITANGGGRRVKTVEDAWRYNAFIKTRPIDHRKPKIPKFVDIFVV